MKHLFLTLALTAGAAPFHAAAFQVPENETRLSTLCAAYLDRVEDLGPHRISEGTRLAVAKAVEMVKASAQLGRAELGSLSIIQAVKKHFSFVAGGGQRRELPLVVDNPGWTRPEGEPVHYEQVRVREIIARHLGDLEASMQKSSDKTNPVRRVIKGCAAVEAAINGLIDNVTSEEPNLRDATLAKSAEFDELVKKSIAKETAALEALRESRRNRREAPWYVKVFSPPSDLPFASRRVVDSGYAKLAFTLSMASGYWHPAAIPLGFFASATGWWAFRSHLYHYAEPVDIMVRGFVERRKIGMERRRWRAAEDRATRITNQLQNLRDLRDLAGRTDRPGAVAFTSYDSDLPVYNKAGFGHEDLLNGPKVRDESLRRKPSRYRSRILRTAHTLTFDAATGEPELTSVVIEVENRRLVEDFTGLTALFWAADRLF